VVVVGERVVVSWNRTLRDIPYTAPVTLAQLAAVDFLGVPDVHGVLVWTTPSGHEAPVAVATKYLPRSTDGRTVLTGLLRRAPDAEPGETPRLTARMGRIAAAMHVALATRSRVLAEPVGDATLAELDGWHRRVRATIDRAALVAAEGTAPHDAPGFLAALPGLEADADALAAAVNRPVVVQRVHGDLHVGRILRWAGGLMITGFGDEPDDDASVLGPQPAARDLARLLQSLGTVAREVDAATCDDRCVAEWLPGARERLLAAYQAELAVAGRPELFDEPLLAAFEAEHAAHAVVEAARRAGPAS
jgi:maltokinase